MDLKEIKKKIDNKHVITFSEWDQYYKPLKVTHIYDGKPWEEYVTFETLPDDQEKAIDMAMKFSKDKDKAFLHIWTEVDGDNNSVLLLPGFHRINRIQYYVTEKPFANTINKGFTFALQVEEDD